MEKLLIIGVILAASLLSSCKITLTEPFADLEELTEIVATETDIEPETTTIVTTQPVAEEMSFSDNDYALDWQNAYAEFLSDPERTGIEYDSMPDYYPDVSEGKFNLEHVRLFFIGDINNDGVPEMIFALSPYGAKECILAYSFDGEIETTALGGGPYGFIRYIPETGQIIKLNRTLYNSGAYGIIEDYALFEWTADGYVKTVALDRDPGAKPLPDEIPPGDAEAYFREKYPKNTVVIEGNNIVIYGQGYINGEAVSFEEFEFKLNELRELYKQSKEFDFVFDGDNDAYRDSQIFADNFEGVNITQYITQNLFY